MTVRIEIPDEQAATLVRKAASEGLSLESWLSELCRRQANGDQRDATDNAEQTSVVDQMRRLRARIRPDPDGWTTRDYVNFGHR